ncbi:hypothetical protein E5940_001000 [Enterococcus faecalis]|uniref:hypothetical protein n=1 Tax=Enterococcus faecalis TaxID=1351 RepID=UPI000A191714|nr:hypothetical protein [Enterococcus faecalis]EGO2521894.1 hypothetical protein [Enterococcus faecalis]EGO7852846.1 hypothetical protein [Enterococcus faecalis]EGO8161193.1 hypothetical protein [Enterococcus faecalis]EGO9119927.1 hypothetical protein [Enterococcus faecalis]NSP57313.1 hypothetical protein [Enterococcus faecalis]
MSATETVTVATKSDLLTNLNKQTDEIIISGALAQEIYHLKKQQLTETEEMGFLVGSQGAGSFLTYLIEKLSYINSELSPEEQKIEHAILRLYVIKKLTPETTLLRLKQLDY